MCQWEIILIRKNRWWYGFNRPCRVLFPTVDVVAKQRHVKQTEFGVQWESRPKAFDMWAGIPSLPITSWPVDNIHNRVLWCKSISINWHKRHIWLMSVLITRNRLILMNKWFAGCGKVKNIAGLHFSWERLENVSTEAYTLNNFPIHGHYQRCIMNSCKCNSGANFTKDIPKCLSTNGENVLLDKLK